MSVSSIQSYLTKDNGALLIGLCGICKISTLLSYSQNPTSLATTLTKFCTNATGSAALAGLPKNIFSYKLPSEGKLLLRGIVLGINTAHLLTLLAEISFGSDSTSELPYALNLGAFSLSLLSNIYNIAIFKRFLTTPKNEKLSSLV